MATHKQQQQQRYTIGVRRVGSHGPLTFIDRALACQPTSRDCTPLTHEQATEAKRLMLAGAKRMGEPIEVHLVKLTTEETIDVMRTLIDTELMACTDCRDYVATGETPDNRDDIEADIQAHLDHPTELICCGDSDKNEEFSSTPCECCGSRLAGQRHNLVAFGWKDQP